MGEKKEVDNKKNEGEKKNDGGGQNTVVLKFDMHCEGCAKKVRKSIKKSQGVESVKTDCAAGKLTVVGNVDPVKIKEKVEEKMKKKVELVSVQPNKPSTNNGGGGGEKKSDEKKSDEKKSEVKSDDKKDENKETKVEKPKEPQVATALLKTRVHCEGCAQKIKKIVGKFDGVQDVNVDLQKDMIIVKGTMDMKDLLPYLNVKLKRNVELAPAKKDEGAAGGDKKPKEGKDKAKEGGSTEKPKEGGGGGSTEKPAKGGGDKKEGGKEKKDASEGNASNNENVTKIEVNKMEYNPYAYGYGAHAYTFDPRQQGQTSYSYSHQVVDYWHEPEFSNPPQMFSDENPNACSVM